MCIMNSNVSILSTIHNSNIVQLFSSRKKNSLWKSLVLQMVLILDLQRQVFDTVWTSLIVKLYMMIILNYSPWAALFTTVWFTNGNKNNESNFVLNSTFWCLLHYTVASDAVTKCHSGTFT